MLPERNQYNDSEPDVAQTVRPLIVAHQLLANIISGNIVAESSYSRRPMRLYAGGDCRFSTRP